MKCHRIRPILCAYVNCTEKGKCPSLIDTGKDFHLASERHGTGSYEILTSPLRGTRQEGRRSPLKGKMGKLNTHLGTGREVIPDAHLFVSGQHLMSAKEVEIFDKALIQLIAFVEMPFLNLPGYSFPFCNVDRQRWSWEPH